jgi:hypothetical protein
MKIHHAMMPVLCLFILITGCAQPPADQINAAEQAVKEAQQSGAPTYAADDYAKLEGLLEAMKKEVADQDARYALFRDYDKAEQHAIAAKTEAERIKAEAVKKMEDAKSAAKEAHRLAQDAVKSTLDLVAKAPSGKDRAALESIKTDADVLKASLNDVQMMIDKGEYLEAETKAKAIHEKSRAVSQEIETALAKIAKAKSSTAKKK